MTAAAASSNPRFETLIAKTLYEDRVSRVAHALCKADGKDPEAEITVGTDVVEDGGGERYHEVTAPAWTSYDGEARRMIAAVRAMSLLE